MLSVNYTGCFGDKRLERRGGELHARLLQGAAHSIQALAQSRAEQKAFYRFLHNDKASEDHLVVEMAERCASLCAGRLVLCISDTSEVDLCAHSGRIYSGSGVGGIDNDYGGLGFKLHPSLVVDASNGFPLGFSDVLIWNRDTGGANKKERAYKKLPIEEKESYKWIGASQQSKGVLQHAAGVIVVQDREGDIFEQFVRVPDGRTFLLVRSQVNRRLSPEAKLWEALSGATLLGHYQVELSGDRRRNTPHRTATMEVRCVEVELPSPVHRKNKGAQSVKVHAIEAREVVPQDSPGYEPILWRLLTTYPVADYCDVLQLIEWYSWRWMIEELFRMLKKEGFNIEASELENPWAIRKLTVMMLDVVVKLMQLHIAYHLPEGESPLTAGVFSGPQQQCLAQMNQKLQGKTNALKNPYPPQELKWAVWIVARMGGWKGYASQRPPGMTTLFHGLEKFYQLYEGWTLQKDVGTR